MMSRTFLRAATRSCAAATSTTTTPSMIIRSAGRPLTSSARISSYTPSPASFSVRSIRGYSTDAPKSVEGSDKTESSASAEAQKEGEDVVVEDPKLKELQAKIEEAGKKAAELTTALQYSQADFQNLQRRSSIEQDKARDYAISKFASDLLSTIDILTLALKHVTQPVPAENTELSSLFDGVKMTQAELLKVLKKHGVEQFDPTGEKFDPNLHEALFQAPIPGKTPGTVFDVSSLGYTLKGRVIRAAQVGVVRE
ncbi:Molecular chaperone of the GrpE family [Phaffia rhodozyma]|uniref:GrpE protein homolog n=1 Tax=Phaffia rhodozyma TaxID=264483 RepID=A0A0F7SGI2_PHARH|nr:Molecular chaperone of the GrpE family [Phaffia rhodozyma]